MLKKLSKNCPLKTQTLGRVSLGFERYSIMIKMCCCSLSYLSDRAMSDIYINIYIYIHIYTYIYVSIYIYIERERYV